MKMSPTYKKGFTLIETVVSLAILGLIFALALGPFITYYRHVVFQGQREQILAILDEARKSTLSSYNSSQYGVHFATSTVTLFQGAFYISGSSGNSVYTLNTSVQIKNISFTGGGSNVLFKRISGETDQNGSFIIDMPVASTSKSVTIYNSGLVEVQ